MKKQVFLRSKKEMYDILCLKSNEKILTTLKLFPFKGISKNNVREPYVRLFITTDRTIFVSANKQTDFFSHKELRSILVTRKALLTGDLPAVIVKSVRDTYEILFASICPYKRTIRKIVDCLREMVPDLDIRIDPKYRESFIKDVLTTKITFK